MRRLNILDETRLFIAEFLAIQCHAQDLWASQMARDSFLVGNNESSTITNIAWMRLGCIFPSVYLSEVLYRTYNFMMEPTTEDWWCLGRSSAMISF